MSQPTGARPALPLHGAVDLAALRRPTPPPGGPTAEGAPASGAVVDVTEASFAGVVERSTTVPVVVALWSASDPVSSTVVRTLADLATELAGRFLLARVEVERAPQVAQAVGSQTGATVAAVVRGQAVPLPPLDQATREQVRALLDQVLQMAAANGVTGRVPLEDAPAAETPEEPPLPPRHQEAYDAIQRDDLEAAAAAYAAALAENPRDDMAKAGLAQVDLMRRTRDVDPAAARAAAEAAPGDLDAQLALADLELMSDRVEEAFAVLLAAVRRTTGPEREAVRVRLVELFTVVGDADPRVMAARRALASALY
ncbi:tetratricopeptide repeat protein [Actinotalea fermentans]|uniref:Co-chaperone YbbN n=1 Tax=Actinotalea fermentans TaxID=43671 RepID=A0A511YT68_9CELL|nr:tetratricopeptide repeat protein [Actinotalea fermentans]KGM16032.1 thioredoxin [Actinotalea fermentans ATCC 43279 = JCM 9966 = DSM 3133]GEN78391.1 co-chaperone YbbN [Actinotalea fermentans]